MLMDENAQRNFANNPPPTDVQMENNSDDDLKIKMIFNDDDDDDEQILVNNSPKQSDKSCKITLTLDQMDAIKPEEEQKEYPESDSPINIKIIGLDDDSPDQQTKFRIDLEDDEEEKQPDSTAQNDNIGKISIPIDFNESEEKDKPKEENDLVFKIPTSEMYDNQKLDSQTKIKLNKREEKENSKMQGKTEKLINSESGHQICINLDEIPVEETKVEPSVINSTLKNFYKLDNQKVTMQVSLQDPSKPETDSNSTCIKGQCVLMFNRLCSADQNQEATRDLNLELHSKHISVQRISIAKRYKKKSEDAKTVETLHERKEDLEYEYNDKEYELFREHCMYQGSSQNYSNEPMTSRPSVQSFGELQLVNFLQERKKGLLKISHVLNLEKGEEFPANVDLIIDYEVEQVLDYGLSYRQTNEPSKQGCYLATTHRYFETHYWMP